MERIAIVMAVTALGAALVERFRWPIGRPRVPAPDRPTFPPPAKRPPASRRRAARRGAGWRSSRQDRN